MMTFADFFHRKRIGLGLTLREFCARYRLDPGNLSKLESGRLNPPKEEKLKEYARYLRLKKRSPEWNTFFDLAALSSGKLPIRMTDKRVAAKLPLLFRTIEGKKLSPDKMDKLIQLIKES
ncbi:MAG: helix-turn-helix transcriptional regulator [Candidatus Omnitrophota bacterium]